MFCLVVAFVFLYCLTTLDTSVFALVITVLAHINIVIALSAVFAEMGFIFIIFHAHSVTAIRFGFTAIKTLSTGFAHFCHAERRFAVGTYMFFKVARHCAVFTA